MTRRFFAVFMVFIWLLLSGCGDLPAGQAAVSSDPSDAAASSPQTSARILSDAEPAVLWGRSQLSQTDREAYDIMSAAIAAQQETPVTVDADETEIPLILTALRIDHPEYFWFDGETSIVSASFGGYRIRTECAFVYTMDPAETETALRQIADYTDACLSSPELTAARTDYEKILGIYRYLIANTSYVIDETDQSILSVMIRGEATCAGYARSFQYLMNQLGIPCTLALGESADGAAHGWNMVQCDGQWYQIDVTWGDPVSEDDYDGRNIRYTYCLVTDDEIYRDHTLISDLTMPVCTATEYNYYVQEGRRFDSWDRDAYAEAMGSAVSRGESVFAVRFTDPESYREACLDLFSEEGIWDVLARFVSPDPDTGTLSVAYSQDDTFYEISVKFPSD